MRYFYDTEFVEDGRTVDLISVGVVAEDGREFYMCSLDFNPDKANEWVTANVLPHLPERPPRTGNAAFWHFDSTDYDYPFPAPWGSRGTIGSALKRFIGDDTPELWAYCGAFDHVILSQLFKGFQNWPNGWPYFTHDVAQLMSEWEFPKEALPDDNEKMHDALHDARWNKRVWERVQLHKAAVLSRG